MSAASRRPAKRGLALLLLVALAALAGRLLLPPQMHDERHLEAKAAYLRSIAELPREGRDPPSFIVILFDDLGHGDLGVYGSVSLSTPRLDRLAAAGLRFTDAYSASPYCSASRAGLLTGRHPTRMGFDHVLQPAWTWKDLLLRIGGRNRQLPAEEITLPEALRAAGYATGMFGKWHLGDASPSLPNDRGFERFFGSLYSNDQRRPTLWRDRQVAESHPIDQASLTGRYTEEALSFLRANRDRPFFVFLPHTFPHEPLHASERFLGSSEAGLYGDVVAELDSSVGALVDELSRLGLTDTTLLLITSDNGPWFQGSPGGLRGRKMEAFEGGMRVPFLVSWPGRIAPPGTSPALVSGLDLFPTLLELAGVPLPSDRVIDGVSLVPLLAEPSQQLDRSILYTRIRRFQAVRRGRFKYHRPQRVLYGNPMDWSWGPFVRRGPWLFDLARDPDESYDVTARHPALAAELAAALDAQEAAWRLNPRGWID